MECDGFQILLGQLIAGFGGALLLFLLLLFCIAFGLFDKKK